MYPVIIVTGKAGSGKDSLTQALIGTGSGVSVAQADPIKRFGQMIFHFSNEQLWGPSECRNAPDPRPASEFIRLWESPAAFAVKAAWLRSLGLLDSLAYLNDWAARYVLGVVDLTPRHFLQKLGTEFGRNLNENIWIDTALQTANQLLTTGGTYSPETGLASGGLRPAFVAISDGRFANEILAVKARGGLAIKVESGEPPADGVAAQHISETDQDGIPASWFDAVVVNRKTDGLPALRRVARNLLSSKILPAATRFDSGNYRWV